MSLHKQKLIILESVDSTNNYAMALIQKGEAESGNAVFAIEQTAGKGTRGKHWNTNKGENIIISIMAQMQWLSIPQQFQLSVCTALACFDFFSNYTDNDIKIKWPNDIFINDRKAGGILIETILKGNLWQWAVIGIGLNINQIDFENKNITATSLQEITGKNYDVIALGKELQTVVLKRINDLRQLDFKEVLSRYNDNLFCKNKTVRLKRENVIFETMIEKVTSTGELVTKDSIERRLSFGEIQWIDYK